MAENFSGVVRVSDMNDFISPSQLCVVGLSSDEKAARDTFAKASEVKIQGRKGALLSESVPSEAIKVTLHDCLACSGCITSAETVMLEQQSSDEFLSQLRNPELSVVVSLSPQSRASMAARYGLTPLQTFQKLTGYLKSLGVKAVFDTSFSRDVSLMEACEEFVTRYRESCPEQLQTRQKQRTLPMLASACPGWVCYAEKTHGSHILPFISTTKSPQQVMGALVKRFACKQLGLRPEQIFHVTIMPCYDKKLEASREDFIFSVEPGGGDRNEGKVESKAVKVTEVDSVLTSGEIYSLLQAQGIDFAKLKEFPLDRMFTNIDDSGHLYGVRGGSGGYAECIFKYAAKVLFGKVLEGPLQFKTLRNSDFTELALEVDGKQVLNFACAYGFRNIQNLVRKVKLGRSEYHFVEIMACPGGCLNGGGQIKPERGRSLKDFLQELESVYMKEVGVMDPSQNPVARAVYDQWLQCPMSTEAKDVLHTIYHRREKSVGSQISNW